MESPKLYTKEDLRDAFREGWKRRDETISLNHRHHLKCHQSVVLRVTYHSSMFLDWFKKSGKPQ